MALGVDSFVLERAKKAAKVSRDVMVIFEVDETHPMGVCYASSMDDEPHVIYIHPEFDRTTANYILFHELKHAAQEEESQIFSSGAYRQQLIEAGIDPEVFMGKRPLDLPPETQEAYSRMPAEIEANHFARNYCDLYEVITG